MRALHYYFQHLAVITALCAGCGGGYVTGPGAPRSGAGSIAVERVELRRQLAFGMPMQDRYPSEAGVAAGFVFVANAGGPIEIEVNGSGHPVVTLYGPQRNDDWAQVVQLDQMHGGGRAVMTHWVTEPGTYLIAVQELRGAAAEFLVTIRCNGHDCRVPCGTHQPPCPTGSACQTAGCTDPICNAFCFPLPVEPPGEPPAQEEAKPAKPGKPGLCGLDTMAECPEGLFCLFDMDSECGARQTPGLCSPKPEACAQIYQPVCGCDGKTYENACAAYATGTSVASTGECIEEDLLGQPLDQPPCVIGGCNGDLCVEEGAAAYSTCEANPKATCYDEATCERQADGACAWTKTDALKACLAAPVTPASESLSPGENDG